MINANELMLGNWLQDEYGKYWQVEEILQHKGDELILTGNVGATYKSMSGVPITPEILEKAGFEQYMDDSIEWHIEDPSYYGEFENGTFKETGGEGITSHIGCKYLHQLQNHFFLHTQQHLNIQL